VAVQWATAITASAVEAQADSMAIPLPAVMVAAWADSTVVAVVADSMAVVASTAVVAAATAAAVDTVNRYE
jgi:hypothetical protein